MKKHTRHLYGYSLVEIFIVLTVMMMLASALGINYYQSMRDQRIAQTEQTIEQAKDALVQYAATHKTRAFQAVNYIASVTVHWDVPPNRPYLPCPDVDFDGWEDRDYVRGAAATFDPMAASASFNVLTISVAAYLTETISGVTVAILPLRCVSNKGALPWRSLGDNRFLDAWGNPLTYRVAPDFSDMTRGFDETMLAGDAQVMPATYTLTTALGGQTVILNDNVRATGAAFAQVQYNGKTYVNDDRGALICISGPCSALVSDFVIQGKVVTAAGPTIVRVDGVASELPVVAEMEQSNIISGIPVVLVSHGENGYGAWTPTGICGLNRNATPDGTVPIAELQNAFRYAIINSCSVMAGLHAQGGRQYGFVARPHAFNVQMSTGLTLPMGGTQPFDDIVGWMSPEELADRLSQRGIFPVGKLPPVGLEEH